MKILVGYVFEEITPRQFYLLLNHRKWRDSAFINCTIKKKNSSGLFFILWFFPLLTSASPKPSFHKLPQNQRPWTEQGTGVLGEINGGGKFWEMADIFGDMTELVAFSPNVFVQNMSLWYWNIIIFIHLFQYTQIPPFPSLKALSTKRIDYSKIKNKQINHSTFR